MPAIKAPDTPAEGKTALTRFLRVAVAVAVVCAVGAIIALYFGLKSPSVPAGPPRTAAQAFFTDLKANDFKGAYGSLCSITRQSLTQEQFVSGQQDLPPVDGYTITKVSTQRVSGAPAATVVVDFTRQGNVIEHHNVPMVQENGHWFVCGEPY